MEANRSRSQSQSTNYPAWGRSANSQLLPCLREHTRTPGLVRRHKRNFHKAPTLGGVPTLTTCHFTQERTCWPSLLKPRLWQFLQRKTHLLLGQDFPNSFLCVSPSESSRRGLPGSGLQRPLGVLSQSPSWAIVRAQSLHPELQGSELCEKGRWLFPLWKPD